MSGSSLNTAADENQADVLIVGAGPTGLTLATTLIRRGIRPLIVDKLANGQNTSRAAVIHAHTLEVLDELGVCEQLEGRGMALSRFSIRDRDRVLASLNFDALPSRYAHLLMLPQDITEQVLADAFVGAGGVIRRGCTVESLTETSEGIDARTVSAEGRHTIRARYVIGADGMHSVVRQAAGIGFTGTSYPHSFMLADVQMRWRPGHDEVMIFFSPAGLMVVAPLPATDRYRIVATVDNAPETPAIADLQALLDVRGPAPREATVSEVLWGSRFHVHHRVADHYRRGRYLLVGDAAHVHSPAGGQGMNTGLVDAVVLGKILAEVVSGNSADDYLDRYETIRRPAAQQVLKLASVLTGMATVKHPVGRQLRNAVLRAVGMVPAVRTRLEMNLSGLSRKAAAMLESA